MADDFDKLVEQINKDVEQYMQRISDVTLYALATTVADAKERGNYKDHTANLRSSISYVTVKDNKIDVDALASNVSADVKDNIQKLASTIKNGGVIVAGMPYATYVEAKGYDVITGACLDFSKHFEEGMK